MERAAAIRLAWDPPASVDTKTAATGERWMDTRRRLLTEKKSCAPDCECRDCNLENCRQQLDEAIAKGQLTKGEAHAMWESRILMD